MPISLVFELLAILCHDHWPHQKLVHWSTLSPVTFERLGNFWKAYTVHILNHCLILYQLEKKFIDIVIKKFLSNLKKIKVYRLRKFSNFQKNRNSYFWDKLWWFRIRKMTRSRMRKDFTNILSSFWVTVLAILCHDLWPTQKWVHWWRQSPITFERLGIFGKHNDIWKVCSSLYKIQEKYIDLGTKNLWSNFKKKIKSCRLRIFWNVDKNRKSNV